MKRTFQFIISATASVVALTALGQATNNPSPAVVADSHERMQNVWRADMLNSAAKASDVLGMPLQSPRDEKLGKVEELAVDVESGRIVQVILSTGGFLNIGDTLTAVPPGALRFDGTNNVLRLNADRMTLKLAHRFTMANWTNESDYQHLTGVYRQFSEDSAFGFIQTTDATNGTGRNVLANIHQPMIPMSRLAHLQRASKLMDFPVQNLQNEKLGKVENLLLDLTAGRIVAMVVSSGGFLGIDNELSAIPPSALRFTPDREALLLDVTKESLSHAPHFKADQWPDFAEPTYAGGIYQAYHIRPYFSAPAPPAADNTASNSRDRNNTTLTPIDQGTSTADIGTTAQIRKEIIADKDMSANARNVKIITLDGRVTLRGPVNNADEKRLIGEIADRAVTSANVNNQLEVTSASLNP